MDEIQSTARSNAIAQYRAISQLGAEIEAAQNAASQPQAADTNTAAFDVKV